MKFVSHIRRFSIVLLGQVTETVVGIGEREIVPSYQAQFKQSPAVNEMIAFAHATWPRVHGYEMEVDEVTIRPLVLRLSAFDTEAEDVLRDFDMIDRALDGMEHPDLPRGVKWKAGTMKELAERKLLARAETKQDFALYVETPLPAPWPAYEDFPGDDEDRLGVLKAQQHPLSEVLAYERQKQLRPNMITLLEEELQNDPAVGDSTFVEA